MDEDKHRHTVWLTEKAWVSVQKHCKDGNSLSRTSTSRNPFSALPQRPSGSTICTSVFKERAVGIYA